MKHEIASKLRATVQTIEPVLRAISGEDAAVPLKEGGWSRKQVLGHLIDSASNNHQRFVRLQQFEHLQLAGYAQDHWVGVQGYAEADWGNLIDLWSAYNLHLSNVIRRIKPETLKNRCELTPGRSATLDYFVDDYLGHLQHHLRQMGVSNETTVPYPLPGSPED
jgi:hypothetical protein